MNACCNTEELAKNFDCKIEETKEGVAVHIAPKDPAKRADFKRFVESGQKVFKGFCPCCG